MVFPPRFSMASMMSSGIALRVISKAIRYTSASSRMRTDAKDNRKKHIILTKKAREAEPTVKGYMAELTGELLRAIPEYSLPEIENALQMILDKAPCRRWQNTKWFFRPDFPWRP